MIRNLGQVLFFINLLQYNDNKAIIAANILGDIRAQVAVPDLINVAKSKFRKPEIRLAAIKNLGKIGDNRAVFPLMDILTSPNEIESLREQAAISLGNIKDKSSIDSMLGLICDKNVPENIRIKVIQALSNIKDKSCIGILLNLLYDKSVNISIASIKALLEIDQGKSKDIIEAIINRFEDKNSDKTAQINNYIADSIMNRKKVFEVLALIIQETKNEKLKTKAARIRSLIFQKYLEKQNIDLD